MERQVDKHKQKDKHLDKWEKVGERKGKKWNEDREEGKI